MNKKVILTTSIFVLAIFFNGLFDKALSQNAAQAPKTQAQSVKKVTPINTTSLSIVNNPAKYLNKTVKIQATFDKFSTLGLDYKKALRESKDYIGILIQRDDVLDHNIPLSEMKLFMKKDLA